MHDFTAIKTSVNILIYVHLWLNSDYLLYVSDVHQFNDFILLRGAGSGAGALEAQVTDRERKHLVVNKHVDQTDNNKDGLSVR